MNDDPIETDDPIDAALWHAEEKVALFTAHVKAAHERVKTLTHICQQWKLHAETLRHARFRRPRDPVEDDDTPTQPSFRTVPSHMTCEDCSQRAEPP